MARKEATEIGLVLYPGAQHASVLGLTDLFAVANRVAAACPGQPPDSLRVTHWRQEKPGADPVPVFDSGAGPSSGLSALILPPALDEPVSAEQAASLVPWLRAQHAKGVVLGSVCAGASCWPRPG